jgi:putative DNA primase/helicase
MGWFARFLFAKPKSTQGTRKYTKAPEGWPKLSVFEARLVAILGTTPPINEKGQIESVCLDLDGEAKAEWIELYDAIEVGLAEGKEFYDVRDVAAKAADNIARLAALFHIFEHGTAGRIGARMVQAAGDIVLWHLQEAKRYFHDFALPAEIAAARQLEEWLHAHIAKNEPGRLSRGTVQQLVIPKYLRKRETLNAAIDALTELGRARLAGSGKQKNIEIRPSLLNRFGH